MSQEDLDSLADLARQRSRLWLVQGDTEASDPGGLLASWLTSNAYPAGQTWYGPLQLFLYAPPAPACTCGAGTGGQECTLRPTQQVWNDRIALLGYCRTAEILPLGQIARIDLLWGPTAPALDRYKVFVHLVNSQGDVVSQHDGEPERPTDAWQPGDEVTDRHGLLLPFDLPPGLYRMVVGLYPVEGGDRLTVCDASSGMPSSCADTFTLAQVDVEGGTAVIVPDATP